MKFFVDDGELRKSLETLKTTIPAAAKAAGRVSLKELAEKTAQRVRDMIPDEGGWYDIYRDSIRVVELTPDQYEVEANTIEMNYGSLQADRSLLWLTGGDDVARLMATENPWTVDTLPSVKDGITTELIVRPASESETDFHRRRHRSNASELKKTLNTLNKPLQENELAVINGRTLADVPFLVLRMEYGLGGFPRLPIWNRLDSESDRIKSSSGFGKEGLELFSKNYDKL